MSRVADSTIKGFIYQFNLTLNEVLKSSNEEIQVEGIIEDIDIRYNNMTKAIQCKYHEAQENYTLSKVYEPILQMIKHYIENPHENIQYILYAYFPNEEEGKRDIIDSDIISIINTKNTDLISEYISHIKECEDKSIDNLIQKKYKTKDEKAKIKKYFIEHESKLKFDIQNFRNRFTFILGEKYEKLENMNKRLLIEQGLSKEDVDDLFFPNAIQTIVDLSIQKEATKRIIKKSQLLQSLTNCKKTAITRWTKELLEYKKILERRRKQLKSGLDINNRKRCFIINPDNIENFEEEIVKFLYEYVKKYSYKVKLHTVATFCFLNKDDIFIKSLTSRLYDKEIKANDGYKGEKFFKNYFMKEPEKNYRTSWWEFNIKIINYTETFCEIINDNKPEDIFLIDKKIPNGIDTIDINIELLDVEKIEELEFVLRLKEEI